MLDSEKVCENCNEKMCHICNPKYRLYWSPNETASERLKIEQKYRKSNKWKPRESVFYLWAKRKFPDASYKGLARKLEYSRNSIIKRFNGVPVCQPKKAVELALKTGIPPLDLIFTAEFLKKNKLTREEIINGIKH